MRTYAKRWTPLSQMRTFSPLLTVLLHVLAVAILSTGCSALPTKAPTPPNIKLYMHNANLGVAACSQTTTSALCSSVPMDHTHKWFMLPSAEFEKVMNYIDQLICIVDGGTVCGSSFQPMTMTSRNEAMARDLQNIKLRLLTLRRSLETQKGMF